MVQDLNTANGTITHMKARLDTLESMTESAGAHEKQLVKDLENARIIRNYIEDKLLNQVEQRDLWIKSMVDIAEHLNAQITKNGHEELGLLY